jgi:dihydrolipoamide dehydrogenase
VTHGLTETACVGLSEAQARATGGDVDVMKMPVGGVARGLMIGEPGMVKVVSERGGTVLGMHIVGPLASELAGEAATVTALGLSINDVASVIRGHPTLSETFSELNLAMSGRPLHKR